MMGKSLLIICFMVFGSTCFAQDLQFSQFYASPLYLNPAFTGSSELTRLGLNFRNQWPGLDRSFISYSAYLDHFIAGKNSGVGMVVNGSRESLSNLQSMEVGLLYSYRLRFGESKFLHFGVQGSFVSRSANFEEVVFSSQLDIDRGTVVGGNGNWVPEDRDKRFADFNTGMLYYQERFWLGASAHHLTRPNISYFGNDLNKLPIKYSLHGGVQFNLPSGFINDYFNNSRQERTFSLAFNYKQQGIFNQLDIGTELYFEPLILGLWYRGLPTKNMLPNNEALIAVMGFSLASGLDMGYSYDYTISKLGWRNSGGSHEISLRYSFDLADPSGKTRSVLPSFRY